MATSSVSVPLLTPPTYPDTSFCSSRYGEELRASDCLAAAAQFPRSAVPQTYVHDNGRYSVPMSKTVGGCTVILESSGPSQYPERYTVSYTTLPPLRPNDVRTAAGWIINECVTGQAGNGGFATLELANLVAFLVDPAHPMEWIFDNAGTAFYTVTVSGPNKPHSPGGYDPALATHIALLERESAFDYDEESQDHKTLLDTSNELFSAAWAMTRIGGNGAWWEYTSSATVDEDDMSYECDSSLGNPREVDCNQLEYSQLGPLSDSVSIGPGTSKVLSSNICNVAISSDIPIVITWEQIKVALDSLINLCVANPLSGTATGGTAYYGHQSNPAASWKRQTAITGLNALPQHVNLTLYTPGHFTPA